MQSAQGWSKRHFDADDDEVGGFVGAAGRTDLAPLLFLSS